MDTILFVVIVSPCRKKEKENIFFLASTLSDEITLNGSLKGSLFKILCWSIYFGVAKLLVFVGL